MTYGASVIIPTFDRAELLSRTLESLQCQVTENTNSFEVIVCDDGSSDGTRGVVDRYSNVLDLRYAWQPNLGHRVAAARNMGIALAKYPVTVMLDSGTLASQGFVQAHVDAHAALTLRRGFRPAAVIGNTTGYRFDLDETSAAAQLILQSSNETALAIAAEEEAFADVRKVEGSHIDSATLPWRLFWTTNVSAPTELLRSVGGFDESFVGWGAEDIELAYRLKLAGARFCWSDAAWALELPQHKDHEANRVTNSRNMSRFLSKHQQVDVELFVGARELGRPVQNIAKRFFSWQAKTATSFGILWPVVRADLRGRAVEFDVVRGRNPPEGVQTTAYREIPVMGIHTPFCDGFFRLAHVSRLRDDLWEDWGGLLGREAARIARAVEGGPLWLQEKNVVA